MPAKYAGNDVSILRNGFKAVQWVGRDNVEATILMPDGTVVKGYAEKALLDEKNEMVQFERVGFARVVDKDPKGIQCVFSHR
jgi:glutamyl-tRNA synthetase